MRLLPRTLFGRLVWVLLSGLIVAQLVGAFILLRDRGAALEAARGLHFKERITDIVRVLDSFDAIQQDLIVRALSTRMLRTTVADKPEAQTEHASEDNRHAEHLRRMLHDSLGNDRILLVSVTKAEPDISGQKRHEASHKTTPMESQYTSKLDDDHKSNHTFLVQVKLHNGRWVRFERYLSPLEIAWPHRLLHTLSVLLIAVIVLSLLAVRWVTRPLAVLGNAAEELGRDIYRPPLDESGTVEVRHAARAFNTMQARLARYIQDREHLLAAVSHDLKTPITRLRLRTELLDDETLKNKFIQDLSEMESMTAATLDFMRDANSGESVQLMDVMALLESLQADMEEFGFSVEISGTIDEPYPARPMALKRCLTNLIENAVRYGRRATISINDSRERLCITVTDEGPGIPDSELEQVFEPFYRLETSRNRDTGGVGMGLSIARNIARAHGGDLVLHNRSGGGLNAILTLPH